MVLSILLLGSLALLAKDEVWTSSSNGGYSKPAFIGGQEHGKNLILCAGFKNGYHPGKIVGQSCNFGWVGKEILMRQYQVLVKR